MFDPLRNDCRRSKTKNTLLSSTVSKSTAVARDSGDRAAAGGSLLLRKRAYRLGPAAGAVLVGGVVGGVGGVGRGGGGGVERDLHEDERVDRELEHAAEKELRGRAAQHEVRRLERVAARPQAHHANAAHQ